MLFSVHFRYFSGLLCILIFCSLQLQVALRDDAPTNPLSADVNAFVTVNIIRNENTPYFVGQSCDVSLSQNINTNQFLTQVTAQDNDSPVSPVTYAFLSEYIMC